MKYDSKTALADDIRTTHDALCAELDGIPRARHREPGVWGDDWTLADLVAHLAAWQTMFLTWYDDGAKGVTPSMPAAGYKWNDTPRLNRDIWAQHRRRSPAAVRADFDAGYARILAIVDGLSAAELLEPGYFAWTGTHALTTYLGANTASHYRFAMKVIKRWRTARR
jgi:hypothetical protein